MSGNAASTSGNERHGIVGRPQEHLYDLPVQFRWEATRRHPYYQTFWKSAFHYRTGIVGGDPAERMLFHAAHLILSAISVFGQPVHPSTAFEELDNGELDPAFLSGAVQPMTFRALATMMMKSLPSAELTELRALFMNAGDAEYAVEGDDDAQTLQRRKAIGHLAGILSPALDSYADVPLLYIHLGASQRTIVQDMESYVRRSKARRGIAEKRIHTKKLPQYLEVWDLREGWNGEEYDVRGEHTFRRIGERLHRSVSTIAKQHRAAFQMITGHEFSPKLWVRLFAPLKRSEVFQDPESILSAPMRNRLQSPVRRPVPDSVVSPLSNDEDSASVVESGSVCLDDQETVDRWLDAEEMMVRGLADEKIAQRLECDIETVEYFRDRFEEFRR